MDKDMIFCNKIWRHFRKESLCNCTRHGTADSASIAWDYRRTFEWKRRCL